MTENSLVVTIEIKREIVDYDDTDHHPIPPDNTNNTTHSLIHHSGIDKTDYGKEFEGALQNKDTDPVLYCEDNDTPETKFSGTHEFLHIKQTQSREPSVSLTSTRTEIKRKTMDIDDTDHHNKLPDSSNKGVDTTEHGNEFEETLKNNEDTDTPEIKFSDSQDFLNLKRALNSEGNTGHNTTTTAKKRKPRTIDRRSEAAATEIHPVTKTEDAVMEVAVLCDNDDFGFGPGSSSDMQDFLNMKRALIREVNTTRNTTTTAKKRKPRTIDTPSKAPATEIHPVTKKKDSVMEVSALCDNDDNFGPGSSSIVEDFVEVEVAAFGAPNIAASSSTASEENRLERSYSTETGKKIFKCSDCNYQCNVPSKLRSHIKIHTGDKQYVCQICNYRCVRNFDLKKHILNKHTEEKPFKCEVCDFQCRDSGKLTIHVRTHTGERPYSCQICGYTFKETSSLKKHMRKHTGEKPYKCEICDYRCAAGSSLRRHERAHTGVKPYKCDVCEYECKDKRQITFHKKTHTEKAPYKCNTCDYRCYDKKSFNRHMKVHKPENTLKCKLCGVECKRDMLISHMQIHEMEPYNCDSCGFKCSTWELLKEHIKTHTDGIQIKQELEEPIFELQHVTETSNN